MLILEQYHHLPACICIRGAMPSNNNFIINIPCSARLGSAVKLQIACNNLKFCTILPASPTNISRSSPAELHLILKLDAQSSKKLCLMWELVLRLEWCWCSLVDHEHSSWWWTLLWLRHQEAWLEALLEENSDGWRISSQVQLFLAPSISPASLGEHLLLSLNSSDQHQN